MADDFADLFHPNPKLSPLVFRLQIIRFMEANYKNTF